jgi:hypothetical protein
MNNSLCRCRMRVRFEAFTYVSLMVVFCVLAPCCFVHGAKTQNTNLFVCNA